jgi:hypothetical protein
VQQKVCTGNAVVKPGKLFGVQAHVGHHFFGKTAASGKMAGRVLEIIGNYYPRRMIALDRTRLIFFLSIFINVKGYKSITLLEVVLKFVFPNSY